jgi:hypothetical protein
MLTPDAGVADGTLAVVPRLAFHQEAAIANCRQTIEGAESLLQRFSI